MNGGTLYWKVRRCLSICTTKCQSVCVSGELIRASVHGHAFGTLHICPHNCDVCLSGVQHKGFDFDYLVAVAKVSVERGFLVLRVYNWEGLLSVIRSSRVSAIQGFLMY